MIIQKLKAYCCKCGKPIYANVTPSDKLTTFSGGSQDYVDVICDDCTMAMVLGVGKTEKKLHTDFKDAEDMTDKLAYYNAKTKEAERLGITLDKVNIKGFSERLKTVRKKLNWGQGQLAEHFGLKSKQAISLYEKNLRKIPNDIKAWIERVENMLHQKSKKEVSGLLKMGKSSQEKSTEKAELGGGA
jgi:DNA-binding XRE family transcriptional regulator